MHSLHRVQRAEARVNGAVLDHLRRRRVVVRHHHGARAAPALAAPQLGARQPDVCMGLRECGSNNDGRRTLINLIFKGARRRFEKSDDDNHGERIARTLALGGESGGCGGNIRVGSSAAKGRLPATPPAPNVNVARALSRQLDDVVFFLRPRAQEKKPKEMMSRVPRRR